MKTILTISAVALAVVSAGCGGQSDARADQAQYETVQEGSAAGVTATIHGPGETLPPITGTNADTTTAFTLDPNALGGALQQPGTLGSTLPPLHVATPGANTPAYDRRTASRPIPSARPEAAPSQPRQGDGQPSSPAPAEPAPTPVETQPAPPENAPEASTPPPTTTNTAPPPPPAAEPAEPQEPEPAEEPPPPPTTTDTAADQTPETTTDGAN